MEQTEKSFSFCMSHNELKTRTGIKIRIKMENQQELTLITKLFFILYFHLKWFFIKIYFLFYFPRFFFPFHKATVNGRKGIFVYACLSGILVKRIIDRGGRIIA